MQNVRVNGRNLFRLSRETTTCAICGIPVKVRVSVSMAGGSGTAEVSVSCHGQRQEIPVPFGKGQGEVVVDVPELVFEQPALSPS
jgi:hypothetical protein